jgi:hypothetical protein
MDPTCPSGNAKIHRVFKHHPACVEDNLKLKPGQNHYVRCKTATSVSFSNYAFEVGLLEELPVGSLRALIGKSEKNRMDKKPVT